MKRLLILLLMVGCSSSDGADPGPEPTDAMRSGDGAAADGAANPADGAAPGDTGGLADGAPDAADGVDPDAAAPDMAEMLAVGLEPGNRAPEFALPNQAGEVVALADYRGQHVLVMGASSW